MAIFPTKLLKNIYLFIYFGNTIGRPRMIGIIRSGRGTGGRISSSRTKFESLPNIGGAHILTAGVIACRLECHLRNRNNSVVRNTISFSKICPQINGALAFLKHKSRLNAIVRAGAESLVLSVLAGIGNNKFRLAAIAAIAANNIGQNWIVNNVNFQRLIISDLNGGPSPSSRCGIELPILIHGNCNIALLSILDRCHLI